jgi:hypothetical protein
MRLSTTWFWLEMLFAALTLFAYFFLQNIQLMALFAICTTFSMLFLIENDEKEKKGEKNARTN